MKTNMSHLKIAYALSRLSSEDVAPIPDLNVQIDDICPQFADEYLQNMHPSKKQLIYF